MKKINWLLTSFFEIWCSFWINGIAKSAVITDSLRCVIYRIFKMKVETNRIKPGVMIRGRELIVKGNSLINYNCFIDAAVPVIIEESVSLAFNVTVCTSTHEIGPNSDRAGKTIRKPVTIKKGSWIGASSTILPGVTIGEGCIIAAGSVVTQDCEPNGLYAGVPAKRIKDLP